MSDEISMPSDIGAFADELMDGDPGDIKVVKIYEFKDDTEAHDDALHERIAQEFAAVHKSLVDDLSKKFGSPAIANEEDEFEVIPLCGVFPAAIWELEAGTLFLAASHEDRETPFLLAIGTA